MKYIHYIDNIEEVALFIKKHTGKNLKIEKNDNNHYGLIFVSFNDEKIALMNGDVIFIKSKKVKVLTAKKFTKKMIVKEAIVH